MQHADHLVLCIPPALTCPPDTVAYTPLHYPPPLLLHTHSTSSALLGRRGVFASCHKASLVLYTVLRFSSVYIARIVFISLGRTSEIASCDKATQVPYIVARGHTPHSSQHEAQSTENTHPPAQRGAAHLRARAVYITTCFSKFSGSPTPEPL